MSSRLMRRRPVAQVVLAVLAVQSLPVFAAADDAEERIVVTGTHIKRIDEESASPVVVIDRTAIEGSGAVTLIELLQLSPYNGAGSFNEAFTTGFTPGTAAFDLRGFGPERTLVLVNGKRQPIYPFGANGSNAFVDLNSIPLATVKRVEILKDGASALYGSDAVAGVVNIITYDAFDGTEVSVRGKAAQDGGAESGAVSVLTGGQADKFSWLVGVDASTRQELLGKQRDLTEDSVHEFGVIDAIGTDPVTVDGRNEFSGEGWQINLDSGVFSPLGDCPAANRVAASNYYSFGGQPAVGDICLYDFAREAQLLPETDRASLNGRIGYDFDWAQLSLSYGVVGVDTRSTVRHSSAFGREQVETIDGVEYYTARRLTELGTPTIETESLTQHFAMDWNWNIKAYDFSFSAYHSKTEIDEQLTEGWLLTSDAVDLITAINNNTISLRQPLTAAQVDAYTSEFWHKGESEITAQELRVSGPLIDTVLGPIWLAAGIEHREEAFFDRSDSAILNGDVLGYGTSGAEGDRDLNAAYIETAIPLSNVLELSLSLRQDDYSDFGSSTNPKVGLRLNPTDEWLFRVSWGTGFRAPGLHQLYTNLNIGTSGGRPFVQSGNPDLEPEESESVVVGILVEPSRNTEFSLDLWQIDVDNIITNLGADTIARLCDGGADEPVFCAGRVLQTGEVFTAWNGTTYTAEATTYNDSFLNLAGRKAFGVDSGLGLRFNHVAGGVLKFNLELTYLLSLETESYPDSGIQELEGTSGNPRLRSKMSLYWQGNVVTHYAGVQHVGGWDVVNRDGELLTEVDDHVQLDYQFGYGITANQRIVFGVQNLTDEAPPVSSFSWPFFNQSLYSPLGRTASLEWQGRF